MAVLRAPTRVPAVPPAESEASRPLSVVGVPCRPMSSTQRAARGKVDRRGTSLPPLLTGLPTRSPVASRIWRTGMSGETLRAYSIVT
jgi:hypothetical protein